MVTAVDVVEQVRRRGGIARRSALPRRAVEAALREGRLLVPGHGLVAVPEIDPAIMAAVAVGGVLSCVSAAAAHGFDLIEKPRRLHVTIPRGRPLPAARDLVVHRRAVPSDGYVTTPARTAADCARCLPPREAVVVIDAALRSGVPLVEVMAHLWGRGSGQARAVARRADGRSGASGETCARLALTDAGFSVEPQVHISGVGWVDLLVEGRLVVEIDGLAYHSDGRQFANDRRRDAAAQLLGYRVVRFTWLDAVRRPEYLVAVVTQLLAAG
jgi:very-short-patch-repair endonuclease